jgi:hypothetical protein
MNAAFEKVKREVRDALESAGYDADVRRLDDLSSRIVDSDPAARDEALTQLLSYATLKGWGDCDVGRDFKGWMHHLGRLAQVATKRVRRARLPLFLTKMPKPTMRGP